MSSLLLSSFLSLSIFSNIDLLLFAQLLMSSESSFLSLSLLPSPTLVPFSSGIGSSQTVQVLASYLLLFFSLYWFLPRLLLMAVLISFVTQGFSFTCCSLGFFLQYVAFSLSFATSAIRWLSIWMLAMTQLWRSFLHFLSKTTWWIIIHFPIFPGCSCAFVEVSVSCR